LKHYPEHMLQLPFINSYRFAARCQHENGD